MADNTNTTNEELAKYRKETQEAIEEITNIFGRFMGVLIANGTMDRTDMDYIVGKMSEDEYIKHCKESRDLRNLLSRMFNMTTPEHKPDDNKETT